MLSIALCELGRAEGMVCMRRFCQFPLQTESTLAVLSCKLSSTNLVVLRRKDVQLFQLNRVA